MTTPLVAAVTDYEESVESPLAAKYSRSVARTALHGALAAERARYAALVAAARAVVTVWDADDQSIGWDGEDAAQHACRVQDALRAALARLEATDE